MDLLCGLNKEVSKILISFCVHANKSFFPVPVQWKFRPFSLIARVNIFIALGIIKLFDPVADPSARR